MTRRHDRRPSAARVPGYALACALACALFVGGCGGAGDPDPARVRSALARAEGEPDYVKIRWIRVAFDGVPADTPIDRSRDDAAARAREALAKVTAPGADIEAIAATLSEEPADRDFGIANAGTAPRIGYQPREAFVPAVAKAAFGLEVGRAALVEPDPDLNRNGYFVVVRTD